jgi:hypothetical protein
LKWGREILNQYQPTEIPLKIRVSGEIRIRRESEQTEPTSIKLNRERLFGYIEQTFGGQQLWNHSFGDLSGNATYRLTALHGDETRKRHARNLALICRIMGVTDRSHIHNRVPTIVTSSPVPMGSDTYWAQATWVSQDQVKTGIIFLRSNWPDCYHFESGRSLVKPDGVMLDKILRSDADRTAARESGEWSEAQEVDRIEYATSIRPDLAIRLIDNSCRSYFAQQKREALYRLNLRQRQARIYWACRSIPVFTFAQSLASGNCEAGTRQFLASIGLPVNLDSIEGLTLANQWVKANCPNLDRFINVIRTAGAQIKDTQKCQA